MSKKARTFFDKKEAVRSFYKKDAGQRIASIITLKHNIFTIFAVWEGRKYPLQVLWVQQVLWFKQELLH